MKRAFWGERNLTPLGLMTTFSGVVSYPIPLYANVPIEPQFYQPSRFVITNIAIGFTTIVTTAVDHNYVIGQQVRLIIPSVFGCYQLNEQQGIVISIPATNQVEVNINSSRMDPYFAATSKNSPQILAIGDVNSGPTNNSGRINNIEYIPGSFTNISPL